MGGSKSKVPNALSVEGMPRLSPDAESWRSCCHEEAVVLPWTEYVHCLPPSLMVCLPYTLS